MLLPPSVLHLFSHKPGRVLPQLPCSGKIKKVFHKNIVTASILPGLQSEKGIRDLKVKIDWLKRFQKVVPGTGKTAGNKLRSGGKARNLWESLRKSNRTPVIGTSSSG